MITDFPVDRALSPAWLTIPASHVYGWFAGAYHRRYDRARVYHAPVPVISIGNITVGGTGKTPTVIALAKFLRERFPSLCAPNAIAILSRGYGRTSRNFSVTEISSDWQETGDEPLLIKRAVPDLAVVVHADRCRAAEHAVRQLKCQVIILDDGFQHRQIARDLDIVLIDGEHPLGNGYLLPAGPLREPAKNLQRASILLGIGDQTDHARRLASLIEKPFLSAIPHVRVPESLANGSTRNVFALSAIARPRRFVNSLTNNGLQVIGTATFADHHAFTPRDIDNVLKECKLREGEAIVTTEKDRVRIGSWAHAIPLVTIPLEMQFSEPESLYEILTGIVTKREK